jgi:hypothetical protein
MSYCVLRPVLYGVSLHQRPLIGGAHVFDRSLAARHRSVVCVDGLASDVLRAHLQRNPDDDPHLGHREASFEGGKEMIGMAILLCYVAYATFVIRDHRHQWRFLMDDLKNPVNRQRSLQRIKASIAEIKEMQLQ